MIRFCDVFFSLLGLIVLSPIFVIIALCIVLDSRGGVFYRQVRVGRDGKDFRLFKFRSMASGADKKGLITVGAKDSRVTRVGYFLRKYKLDELPQLLNVVRGEMSLVGPRPSLPKEVAQFEKWMYKRLCVKPGLTCFWQVSGRNNIDFEDWMKLDIKYVDERNLWIDIKLIFKTVLMLFGDKNAH